MTDLTAQPHNSKKRRWLFRLLAVCLGLLPLFLFEGACLVFGWGEVNLREDPFVGFSAIQPLFEKHATQNKYIISPARQNFFAYDEFPVQKPKNGFRIFCLGGSTVQGRPYSIETSFTKWLEIALQQMDPERDWDVINCGGISYASYRLVPILEECLNYEPDLIILCTGHNEFLEERQYGKIKHISPALHSTEDWSRCIRTVNVLRSWAASGTSRPELGQEVQARLDFKNGLKRFHRDPEWSSAVEQHFAANLQRMATLAKQANVPIMFVKPCSNLSGTMPFKDEPNSSLSTNQQHVVQELFLQGKRLLGYDLTQARDAFRAVCENDPTFASAWYELGQCQLLLNETSAAREAFVNARDTDVCPLRMTTPLEDTFVHTAQQNSLPLLDAHQLLEEKTETGILGDFWLVDHVHPSFTGHQEIGLALARELITMQIVQPQIDWEANSRTEFVTYFESLDRNYFHRGQRMLERLRGWTQGNAEESNDTTE